MGRAAPHFPYSATASSEDLGQETGCLPLGEAEPKQEKDEAHLASPCEATLH